jgi:hypothetical protein
MAVVLAQNSPVSDIPTNGHRPPDQPIGPPADGHGATPIPELTATDDVTEALAGFGGTHRPTPVLPTSAPPPVAEATGPVTDEDRNRFGLLLDHAAERGLLDSHEYELRLGELASATTVEQMRTIVTELPMLATPLAVGGSPKGRGLGLGRPAGLAGARSTTPTAGKRRSSPWLLLVVLVVVLVAALAFFAVYAGHIAHTRSPGIDLQAWPAWRLSVLGS